MKGHLSQGRLGRSPNKADHIDIPIGSRLWFPAVVLRETVVVREYASPNAEGSRCLTRGERQERHACCLSSGEIPYYVDKEIPSMFPLLFAGIRPYLLNTISHICPEKPYDGLEEHTGGMFALSKGISHNA